jgi:hypothetical protein
VADVSGPSVSVDEAVAVLNRIHEKDPTVLPALLAHRVECSEELAEDETVQVEAFPADNHSRSRDGGFRVGVLGVLNGVFGLNGDRGWIAAVVDRETGRLLRFERTGP